MKVIFQVYHHKDRNLRRNQGKREESFIVALNAEYFCFIFSAVGRSLLSLDNTARKCPSSGQHNVCSSLFGSVILKINQKQQIIPCYFPPVPTFLNKIKSQLLTRFWILIINDPSLQLNVRLCSQASKNCQRSQSPVAVTRVGSLASQSCRVSGEIIGRIEQDPGI